MITQGSALGGIPGVNLLSPPLQNAPLPDITPELAALNLQLAFGVISAAEYARRHAALFPAPGAGPGLTPLREILAAYQHRGHVSRDWADAEPVVTGRNQVWGYVTPDRQSRRCRVHCFPGAFALVTDDDGSTQWRAVAGMYLHHELSQPASTD